MGSGIYLIQEGNQLIQMEEQHYASEELLQTLLANYPELLAGDQINRHIPRRWLLVSREMNVPGDEECLGRWALDHLFLDQEGIPTLVEVKRSCDTRIRREVVGQMLDYAANGITYWSVDKLKTAFSNSCKSQNKLSTAVLEEFLQDDIESDAFWSKVETNLQLGKIRMIFVADWIPSELLRIIEFLNTQMKAAEVLAIEIKQYAGQTNKVLIPRLLGQPTEVKQPKVGDNVAPRIWDEPSFVAELERQRNLKEVDVAQRIKKWAEQNGLLIRWGKGQQYGSLIVKRDIEEKECSLFRIWTNGAIDGFPKHSQFGSEAKWTEFTERVKKILVGDSYYGYKPVYGASVPLFSLIEDSMLNDFLEMMNSFSNMLDYSKEIIQI